MLPDEIAEMIATGLHNLPLRGLSVEELDEIAVYGAAVDGLELTDSPEIPEGMPEH